MPTSQEAAALTGLVVVAVWCRLGNQSPDRTTLSGAVLDAIGADPLDPPDVVADMTRGDMEESLPLMRLAINGEGRAFKGA